MSKEKITPLGTRVLVEPISMSGKSKGGVVLPGSAQNKPLKGKVLAVGEACTVKEGDTVMYGKNAGTEINNEGHIMIDQKQLIATVK
jgi:chaperonin GroES